jgi:TetR/AcrR family transcriptional regulator, repressor of fatR-cypB operon
MMAGTMSTSGARASASSKHDAILAAALSLFVERGFHGTAVPAVAKRAGVAAGTIYHYFAGKEALVNALFRHHKQAIAQYVYVHFPAAAEPREQFGAMWQHMVSFALDNPEAFAFLELHHHASYLDAESRAVDHQLKEFAKGFVQMAQAKGMLKPMDSTLLMELVFGAFVGMMRAHWEGRLELDQAKLTDAESACWQAIAV